jgi:hypothetical protein
MTLLLLILPGMALAHGSGGRAAVIIGGYQVSPAFAEPAQAGENLLKVQILDGMGLPVRGAQVDISAMPGESGQAHRGGMEGMEGMASGAHDMGGMAGMHGMGPTQALAAVTAKEVEGVYVGVITFSAAGHWRLNTHLMINGQMFSVDFPLEVADAPAAFGMAVLAGFVGLNACIIWLASFTKRKAATPNPIGYSV